ncbi:PTS transporter subunit EIIC [Allocoprobacillus halotolerans]|uniref:PTS transporter subunit EIIC n=1 Tax=Allocoprobacillus halotolerans TaxID=2944914 RepID=A0ABY5HYS4_9FIRM|nr:PTS transporter subunit EIIC [Allocoprobacillus halotolerans]UTY37870.1 PTS transporter subunit EIIC [Allocoprobacillus halotolerans]
MFYIWPFIQNGIFTLGQFINDAGYFGTFVYGILKRALVSFGLHHVFLYAFLSNSDWWFNGCRWCCGQWSTKYFLCTVS